ncbi:MAG: NAD(P)H-dependent oxidoreductase [Kibdelosporangium sp.]
MRKFLFLLGSSRSGGNTETLARRAASSLPADAEQRWIRLTDLALPDFRDTRQAPGGAHPDPVGDERLLLDATLEATDVVIASPLYWYSLSADAKRYLDYWSGWINLPGVPFRAIMRDKTMWGVSVSEELDKSEYLVGMLRRSTDYMRMRWGGVLLGNGDGPDDVLEDAPALAAAGSFFQDVYVG